jgi:hypothetical protein
MLPLKEVNFDCQGIPTKNFAGGQEKNGHLCRVCQQDANILGSLGTSLKLFCIMKAIIGLIL